jgi:hypothetical protein
MQLGRRYFTVVLLAALPAVVAAPLRAGDEPAESPARSVSAVLRTKSNMPTVKGIAPYRDALVVYEYEVTESNETLHVAHWAIVDAIAQPSAKRTIGRTYKMALRPLRDYPVARGVTTSNTLENFDAAVWVQTDQALKLRELGDNEYGRGITERMRTMHALRGQLELLVWGDSRTDQGVDASLLLGSDPNAFVPRTYNIAVASSGLDTLEWLSDHYLPHMPKLRWLVIGVAPRMVSESWDGRELRKITDSPAWRRDRKTDLAAWRNPPAAVLTLEQLRRRKELKWDEYCWGGDHHNHGSMSLKSARSRARHKARNPRWTLEVRDWLQLRRILRSLDRRGVNVLLFTPPTHPVFGETKVISEDSISREGHREFVRRLKRMEKHLARLFVLDVNKGARHDIPVKYFRDLDHLNSAGRTVLSRRLEAFRRTCRPRKGRRPGRRKLDPNADLAPKDTPDGCQWSRLTRGAEIYTDRRYTVKNVPDELEGALLLRTQNDDKTASAEKHLMTLRFDGPARVWLAFSQKDDLPEWTVDWHLSRQRIRTDNGEYILIHRDTVRGWGKLKGPGGGKHANFFVMAKAIRATRD